MVNQVSEYPAEQTFQYQHSLPPLPVPSLEGSVAKYLDAVRPFVTEEEYQVTAAVVKRFGEGIDKDLHQKLLQRARTHRNWVHTLNTLHS
ncbi:peroxisomal carnitine O-octanoyltransferase-like [Oncorhynchus mykiss]|uniref:peroxisomal carnitine O-octanoyltransferase-like n=1 Tax=Oncorhynchus mykiss TaxID=8022 RepID=UPI001878DC8B|nr:peroxisomal carnitine O-octanoyltransferase-like [Oncorhynchus mykiss]